MEQEAALKTKNKSLDMWIFLKKIICIMSIIIATVGLLYIKRVNNYIVLTQFGATTSRQMMGYAIKTKNKKIIIIDGGTKEDSKQLEEYILKNRWGCICMVYNTYTFRPRRST